MGTDFLNPFKLTPQGSIATTTSPDVIALQRVESVVETPPRERVMLGDYGVDLPDYLFDPGVGTVSDDIQSDVQAQLSIWEPYINVLDVIVDSSQEAIGESKVAVEFTQVSPDNPTLTATVLIGGTVVNG